MVHPREKQVIQALVLVGLCLGWSGSALGLDRVTLRRDGQTIRLQGRLVETAQDGGLLLQAPDGVLWAVQPDELVEHTTDEAPFQPLSAGPLAQQLLGELPAGFEVYRTTHYVILYNTSRAYAVWCGSLFEGLYRAFSGFWTSKGFQLSEPEFPLTAIVFADKRSFVDFSRAEVGDAVETIIGYYSLRTNRMVMYDLTGIELLSQYSGTRRTSARINEFLRRPDAPQTVATIVHEATHQIAYNCGLHTRYSDCPMWFSEGIALYFETPDLGSRRGWRGIGDPNRPRLERFRHYLRRRPPDSLLTLVSDDTRLKSTLAGLDAYAEAWALTYFLIKRHPDQYVEYLKLLSQKRRLVWDDAETRLGQFKQAFGDDLEKLDADFVRWMTRLR